MRRAQRDTEKRRDTFSSPPLRPLRSSRLCGSPWFVSLKEGNVMAPATTQWQGGANEAAFLGTLSTDAPWELVHEFANYVRESGTEGEQQAVDAITRRLTAWGIPHTVHHPRC